MTAQSASLMAGERANFWSWDPLDMPVTTYVEQDNQAHGNHNPDGETASTVGHDGLVQFDLALDQVATRDVIIGRGVATKRGKVRSEAPRTFRPAATIRQKSPINIIGPRPDLAVRDAMGVPVHRECLHVGCIYLKRIQLRQSDGPGKAAFGSQLAGLPLGIGFKFFCSPSGFATNSLPLKAGGSL